MKKPTTRKIMTTLFVIWLAGFLFTVTNYVTFPSKEYVIIKGKKPVDAQIFGYVSSSDTNELCLQKNWLSGTKYLSSYDQELQFITYSKDNRSYQVEVPVAPGRTGSRCGRKVYQVQIAAKSPGVGVRYGELQIRITNPKNGRPSQNISASLYVKSICQDKFSRGKWLMGFGCSYFNNKEMIKEMEFNSTSVVLSPELFRDGTVITYDIMPGENYFPTLERPNGPK